MPRSVVVTQAEVDAILQQEAALDALADALDAFVSAPGVAGRSFYLIAIPANPNADGH